MRERALANVPIVRFLLYAKHIQGILSQVILMDEAQSPCDVLTEIRSYSRSASIMQVTQRVVLTFSHLLRFSLLFINIPFADAVNGPTGARRFPSDSCIESQVN